MRDYAYSTCWDKHDHHSGLLAHRFHCTHLPLVVKAGARVEKAAVVSFIDSGHEVEHRFDTVVGGDRAWNHHTTVHNIHGFTTGAAGTDGFGHVGGDERRTYAQCDDVVGLHVDRYTLCGHVQRCLH